MKIYTTNSVLKKLEEPEGQRGKRKRVCPVPQFCPLSHTCQLLSRLQESPLGVLSCPPQNSSNSAATAYFPQGPSLP